MHIISLCMFNKVLIFILMLQLNCIMSTIICNTAVSARLEGGPEFLVVGGPDFLSKALVTCIIVTCTVVS